MPDMASTFLRQSVTSSLCRKKIILLWGYFEGFLERDISSSCPSSSSTFYPYSFSVTTVTFSSSFFTVLRLALKSAFMSLEVSVQAPSMSSVVFFTLLRLGFLMPFSSTIFWFSEMIWETEEGLSFRTYYRMATAGVCLLRFTSLSFLTTFDSIS